MTKTLLVSLLVAGTSLFSFPAFTQNSSEAEQKLKAKIVKAYAEHAADNYQKALETAKDLKEVIDEFVKQPSQEARDTAKEAWSRARRAYSPTEIYRFYGGPIEDLNGVEIESRLNAWPLQESYLDSVEGPEGKTFKTGLINDQKAYPRITKQILIELNQAGDDESNVSLGYHAIEFLLWGQDRQLGVPGQRSWKDYSLTHSPQAKRRAKALVLMSEILVEDLRKVAEAWKDQPGSYYRSFIAPRQTEQSFANILRGADLLLGFELSAERMYTALDSKDQEDEHSCFSDQTQWDILDNLIGAKEVLLGEPDSSYQGVLLWMGAVAPREARELKNTLLEVEADLYDLFVIRKMTFEELIVLEPTAEERQLLMSQVIKLRKIAGLIKKVADQEGIDLGEPLE